MPAGRLVAGLGDLTSRGNGCKMQAPLAPNMWGGLRLSSTIIRLICIPSMRYDTTSGGYRKSSITTAVSATNDVAGGFLLVLMLVALLLFIVLLSLALPALDAEDVRELRR